ncbi:hypothetical protein J6590_079469 [Homalodisca vitripennis]|nr:hypothetical protein J6590_079469 [Homalodisca vitripennis]
MVVVCSCVRGVKPESLVSKFPYQTLMHILKAVIIIRILADSDTCRHDFCDIRAPPVTSLCSVRSTFSQHELWSEHRYPHRARHVSRPSVGVGSARLP